MYLNITNIGFLGGAFHQFIPTDKSNLWGWYRADAGLSLSGASVTQWNDQSGNARHLANSANHPILVQNQVNGLPVIEFDGINDFLKTGAETLNQPFMIYLLARQIAYTQSDRLLSGITDGLFYQSNTVAPNVSMRTGGSIGPTAIVWPVGEYSIIVSKWDGSNSTIRKLNRTVQGGNIGAGNFGGLVLGANSTGGNAANVGFIEVIVRDVIDDATTQYQHYVYLAKRAGLGVLNLITEGDSLTQGAGLALTNLYPHKTVENLVPALWSYNNLAIGGARIADMAAQASTIDSYYDPRAQRNALTVWCGTNNLVDGDSPSAIFTQLSDYCLARRNKGWKVVVFTTLPRNAGGSFATTRLDYNTLIRNNWPTFANRLFDIGNDGTIGQEGQQNDATYYQGDGTHLTATGHTHIASLLDDVLAAI